MEEVGFYKHLFEEDELYVIGDKKIQLKPICIILDNKLTAKNEIFLSNILNAVKQSLNSVSTLSIEALDDLETLETKKIIIFNDASSDITPYEVINVNDKKVLKADSLDAISKDKALKTKLWLALQKFFEL